MICFFQMQQKYIVCFRQSNNYSNLALCLKIEYYSQSKDFQILHFGWQDLRFQHFLPVKYQLDFLNTTVIKIAATIINEK